MVVAARLLHLQRHLGGPATTVPAAAAAGVATLDDYEARSFTSPSSGDTIPYRLLVPAADGGPLPLVLFMHGGGGTGDDNRKQFEGPLMAEWPSAAPPAVIVAPQMPNSKKFGGGSSGSGRTAEMRTHIETVHEILDSLEAELGDTVIDRRREYVTGLSMGSECTIMMLVARPHRFAAAVPVCGGDKFIGVSPAEFADLFWGLPLWLHHGDADPVISVDISRRLVAALTARYEAASTAEKGAVRGTGVRYTEHEGVGHDSWEPCYRSATVIDWLFEQSLQ
jgi:predicted peptidase